MSGLVENLFPPPPPSQQSDAPLLGPILGGGGGDEATPAPTTSRQPLPTGSTPSGTSPAPTDNAADERPVASQGPSDDNDQAQPSPTQTQQPSTPPSRPRPTFFITASAVPDGDDDDAAASASTSLPAPLEPSALPSLPATPDTDDVLIVAPSPTSALVFPTAGLLPPTTLMTLPLSSAIPTGTPLPTTGSGDAEASLAEQADGGAMASLMPALPISLGIGGGVLFFGVVAGMLYKKGVWPFRGDRGGRDGGFEELEDGNNNASAAAAAEMRFQSKWDPRVSGVGVYSTRTRPNGATNF